MQISQFINSPKTFLVVVALLAMVPAQVVARAGQSDSPLPPEVQSQLERAGHLLKSGKPQKASPIIESALNSANDIPKCLAVASFTESYGYPLMEARRRCMQKALSFCSSREDYILVALKSRHFEFFEVTRECINHLIQGATSVDDLLDLARKSQEVALNDVAHMAMEKAYTGVKSVPQALKFAYEVKSLGMDDLERKVVKDLVNDEDNALNLCLLLKNIEDLGMEDLNRYCLKKALDKAQAVEELKCIYEGSRRNRQNDIMQVAVYRAKKLELIQKIQHDQAEYARQLKDWQAGVQQDLSRQQADAEKNLDHGQTDKRFGSNNTPDNPASGF